MTHAAEDPVRGKACDKIHTKPVLTCLWCSNEVIKALEEKVKGETKKAREMRRHLRGLVEAVAGVMVAVDETMRGPSTPERGRQIARLMNSLNIANDSARHFGLGESLKKKQRRKQRV